MAPGKIARFNATKIKGRQNLGNPKEQHRLFKHYWVRDFRVQAPASLARPLTYLREDHWREAAPATAARVEAVTLPDARAPWLKSNF